LPIAGDEIESTIGVVAPGDADFFDAVAAPADEKQDFDVENM